MALNLNVTKSLIRDFVIRDFDIIIFADSATRFTCGLMMNCFMHPDLRTTSNSHSPRKTMSVKTRALAKHNRILYLAGNLGKHSPITLFGCRPDSAKNYPSYALLLLRQPQS